MLRGVAIFGILFVNIGLFAAPAIAYLNPTAWGDFSGLNRVVWLLTHVFAELKFITLFSMLFGAGICLFAERIEARSERPAPVHFRRMGWLLLFGMAHAWLLWPGDILVTYFVCGCLVWWLRKRPARSLIRIGAALVLLPALLNLAGGLALRTQELPDEEARQMEAEWSPDEATLEAEVTAFRGGFFEQQPERAEQALEMQTVVLLFFSLWYCSGAMLLGMALYRLGIVQAEREDGFYRRLAVFGIACGLPLIGAGVWWNFAGGWAWQNSWLLGAVFNYLGAPLLALGYLGLVMLAVRSRLLPALQDRLAAAGRMAFSNYILQTLILTGIFYGHGLGLFGSVERTGQLLIVLAVVAFQLWLSPFWLGRFRRGPLEAVWRRVTYGSR